MDRATFVRLGTLGISIQPASSKNHERRSTLMNKSWTGENRFNGSANSPANGWPGNGQCQRCDSSCNPIFQNRPSSWEHGSGRLGFAQGSRDPKRKNWFYSYET